MLPYLSTCTPPPLIVCLPAVLHSVKSDASVDLLAVHYYIYVKIGEIISLSFCLQCITVQEKKLCVQSPYL